MLTDNVIAELNQEQMTPFHRKLLDHSLSLVDMSRQHMKTYYPQWDDAQNAYKAWQNLDKDDKTAILAGRPTKQRVPMVYAKVQTFKAFILALYFQRPRFYEFDGESEDFHELAEVLLDRDLKLNKWFNIINRWSGNLAKFGLGVLKHSWEEDFAYLNITTETPPMSFFGMALGKGSSTTQLTKVPKRMGNKVINVSPYNFLPDVRHPLTELESGEFCADESDISMGKLLQLESENVCAGIKLVQPLTQLRANWRVQNYATIQSKINYNAPEKTAKLVRLIEVQIKIVPSKFLLADGRPLGTESYPIKYLLWIANDSRIIRLESMSYLHDSFTWDVAQYDEEQDTFLSTSLSELICPLQNTADWYYNTRVANVSQNLEDKLIVDPVGVDMDSIKNRSRIILLKKGASRAGVDKFVKQMEVRDVTMHHMEDVAQVGQMINTVSGLTENLSGNYASGRRSASESRVVTQGASARPKLIAQSAWNSCLAPLGQKMLTNLRQGLPPELIVKYAGKDWLDPTGQDPKIQAAIAGFTSTVEDLLCANDLFAYDGTMESEKNYLAQQLMELFQQLIQLGPTGLLNLQLSPKLLIEKIYELLGVGSLKAYDLAKDPQTLQNLVQQMAQQLAQQMVAQASAAPAAQPAPTNEPTPAQ